MITGRNKNALENHFDRVTELEATLEKKGDHDKLAKVNESTDLADMHYVRQGDPLRPRPRRAPRARCTSVTSRSPCCSATTSSTPATRCCTRMIEVQGQRNATVVALLEVDPSQTHLYGIATVEATDEDDVVQSPASSRSPRRASRPPTWPSSAATCCSPRSSTCSRSTEPGKGGEIQLTDALRAGRADESTGRRVRRRVPRSSLRHRRQARLHQGDRAARRPTATTSAPSCVRGSRSSPPAWS